MPDMTIPDRRSRTGREGGTITYDSPEHMRVGPEKEEDKAK